MHLVRHLVEALSSQALANTTRSSVILVELTSKAVSCDHLPHAHSSSRAYKDDFMANGAGGASPLIVALVDIPMTILFREVLVHIRS
jgi:hypothetical protein